MKYLQFFKNCSETKGALRVQDSLTSFCLIISNGKRKSGKKVRGGLGKVGEGIAAELKG